MRGVPRFFLVLLLASAVGVAQPGGHLQGSVSGTVRTDVPGSPLAGWISLFQSEDGNEAREIARRLANPDGSFGFSHLPVPGTYEVRAEIEGFDRAEARVTLSLISPRTKNLALALPSRQAQQDQFEGGGLWEIERLLAKLGEPELCSKGHTGDTSHLFRLIWLREFHAPVLLDFTVESEKARALYKKASADRSGAIVEREAIVPQHEQVADQVRTAAKELFWSQPFRVDRSEQEAERRSTWIVEGISKELCHVAERTSPASGDPVRRFAEELLFRHAGRQFFYEEVY